MEVKFIRKVMMLRCVLFFLMGLTQLSAFSQLLNSPESVVFDKQYKRYIVSNAGNTQTGGSIVTMDPITHDYSNFVVDEINSPKGLVIVNNLLYCTDVNTVRGFNLEDATQVFQVDVPGASFLNDIASDNSNLYVSDSKENSIFKIEIASENSEKICKDNGLIAPNGVYFDERQDRLLICSFRQNSPIQAFDLKLKQLVTLSATTLNQLDGITLDTDGNCYVSSWADDAVYKFDLGFNDGPKIFSNNHSGPADIFYTPEFNLIAIPNFKSNTIDLIEIGENRVEDEMNPYEIKVFPNPTTGGFSISFYLKKAESVKIFFMNKSGLVLSEHEGDSDKIGPHKMNFEASTLDLSKGVFFIKIIIGESIFMKRLAILD